MQNLNKIQLQRRDLLQTRKVLLQRKNLPPSKKVLLQIKNLPRTRKARTNRQLRRNPKLNLVRMCLCVTLHDWHTEAMTLKKKAWRLVFSSYTMSNKDAWVSPQYKFAHTVSVVNYICGSPGYIEIEHYSVVYFEHNRTPTCSYEVSAAGLSLL